MMFYVAYWAIVVTGWALAAADSGTGVLRGRGMEVSWLMTAAADVLGAVWRAAEGLWGSAALFGIFAAFCAWMAWRRRRKDRRRALAALGGKARARLAALARALRDASRPSPVLRPVHGRAG